MTEKQLGQALLDLDLSAGAGAADPKQLTHKILSSDERRVRRWTWTTIILWVLAALMVLWMLIAMALLMPFQAKLNQEMQLRETLEEGALGAVSMDELQMTDVELKNAQQSAQVYWYMITLGVAGSVGMLGLATLSAVLLVLASRRATLRQINASLLEISEHLKQMGAVSASS